METLSAVSGDSRLDYNKKAMDEIRQSLQNYHVTTNMPASSSHNVLFAANEASIIIIIIKEIYRAQDCPKATSAVLSGAHS